MRDGGGGVVDWARRCSTGTLGVLTTCSVFSRMYVYGTICSVFMYVFVLVCVY